MIYKTDEIHMPMKNQLTEAGTAPYIPAANTTGLPFMSVVSPIYKAEVILPVLVERLIRSLSLITDNFEIILVCDGSPDNSWAVMTKLAEQHSCLIVVKLSRNFGQHYAMTAGLDLARGEWTVVMDCDLQDQPEEIHRLLEKANEGFDIVVARRIERKHKLWKRITSNLFAKLFNLMSGLHLDSSVGSFRIMKRTVVEGLCNMRETHRLFGGLVEWLGFDTASIDVQHSERFEGQSSYNLVRLFVMAMDGMISFSNRPLYISIALGTILSIASGMYGLSLLLKYSFGGISSISGWLSTILAVTFLGGIILLNQGILGLYLGRLYSQSKSRPLYVISKIIQTKQNTKLSGEGQPI